MTLVFEAERDLGAFRYGASFSVENEVVVLFGHSGAGKSLTLQFAAGLMRPDRGHVAVAGETVFDSVAGIDLPPQRRRIGYVVQELALFEHMSVAENVAYGLPKWRNRGARVGELLALLGLPGFEGRSPRTLSGGQRQRVALARALAREAPLLLLDEPFSALDESLRTELRRELIRLRTELGLSVVFVTHDLREAHLLADRLAVFDAGKLLQFEQREAVFRRPASRRVAELTGVANIWRGRVRALEPGSAIIDVDGAPLRCALPQGATAPAHGRPVDVAIRAERVNLRRVDVGETSEPNLVRGTIKEEFAYGATHTLRFAPAGPGPAVEVEIAARPYEVLDVATEKTWTLELPPEDLHVMPAAPSGEARAVATTA